MAAINKGVDWGLERQWPLSRWGDNAAARAIDAAVHLWQEQRKVAAIILQYTPVG